MSDFGKAFDRTMGHEGGYANNPNDAGGETYKGISRHNWPKWNGWSNIDAVKSTLDAQPTFNTKTYNLWVKGLNAAAGANADLQEQVQSFYKTNFWKNLGSITDQRIAEEVFDKAVNCGDIASKWIQRAAGVVDDGQIGPHSIEVINSKDPVELLEAFNTTAKNYYLAIIERKPSQAQFKTSWLGRLKDYDGSQFTA
jgi:lysozyme family protein